jgi:hypothetical protein
MGEGYLYYEAMETKMTTRRQFFGLASGAVAATMLPSAPVAGEVVDAAKAWPNGARFFKDLAGTIPCKPGDPVALMVNTWGSEQTFLSQPDEACRPVYGENASGMGFAQFDGSRASMMQALGIKPGYPQARAQPFAITPAPSMVYSPCRPIAINHSAKDGG